MTNQPTPAQTLTLLQTIAGLPWEPLTPNDYATFAGAGPDARIAEVDRNRASTIAEMLDIRPDLEDRVPMMAILGGETPTLELHGSNSEGEPMCHAFDLTARELF